MSHVVTCKVEMKDEQCLVRAAELLGLEVLPRQEHKLFGGQRATGIGVKLPQWQYPVVVDTETGVAHYDNYNGAWGKQVELDKLVQEYTAQTVIKTAEMEGYLVDRQVAENGDLTLTMEAAYA